MEVCIVFPHQLFRNSPAIAKGRKVILYEDSLYFKQYRFHKKKLVLHRASMKYYAARLGQNGVDCEYIETQQHSSLESLLENLQTRGISDIHYVYTDDYLLERRLKRYSEQFALRLHAYQNPTFMLSKDEVKDQMGESYFMATFYKKQRRKFGLLMNGDEPEGGRWSYDEENRKKLPKGMDVPQFYVPQTNDYVKEAKSSAEKNYTPNPGSTDEFIYPVTHYQAEEWLDDFIEKRLIKFGDYEDALSGRSPILFHSALTPALNIGLLTPKEVIDSVMDASKQTSIPLNSLEGFIRQIIGWREFMRVVYLSEGTYQRTNNYFEHKRPIPEQFWTGETGIEPVDDVILKVLNHSYAHHIERLMVIGNFMLLCEFDPDEIYRWFMELFIDAYDWVMVPNVYGMTQYADGGLITTKPYISGSNYIRKMSDYKKGEWCDVWDGLYWHFLDKHKDKFKGNHRMNMVMSLLNRMDNKKLQTHLYNAEEFLEKL
jgi:deoxyribodipyrimidine photolyase-related protein